jgi:phage tail-like protein
MKRAEIERLLPSIIQRTSHPGGVLYALLEAMEALHAPVEDILEHLDEYFDPRLAPEAFVPYLAGWVDLERVLVERPAGAATVVPPPFAGGVGRLRELVAQAAYLSKWRGTARGLLGFLAAATGLEDLAVEEQVAGPDGRPRPFHIRVRAPVEGEPMRALITRIVEQEKPAYVTYELVFEA